MVLPIPPGQGGNSLPDTLSSPGAHGMARCKRVLARDLLQALHVCQPEDFRAMSIDIFGPHESALRFRSARNELLAANVANADTPGYKARDISFGDALGRAHSTVKMIQTADGHLNARSTASGNSDYAIRYRIPTQPSVDGNTVEGDVEKAQFAENVVRYRASLTFVNSRIKTLRQALSGER